MRLGGLTRQRGSMHPARLTPHGPCPLPARPNPVLFFTPVQDDRVIFHNYTERMLAGQQAKIVSTPLPIYTRTVGGMSADESIIHYCSPLS